jgi:hypothetical protein
MTDPAEGMPELGVNPDPARSKGMTFTSTPLERAFALAGPGFIRA